MKGVPMASLELAYLTPAQERMVKRQNGKGQSWSSSVMLQETCPCSV